MTLAIGVDWRKNLVLEQKIRGLIQNRESVMNWETVYFQ